jgi:hypothetical protein
MTEDRPKHSKLGASGAERWMNCPGSTTIVKALNLPQSDEEDYAIEGSACHEAAAECIKRDLEPWEVVGQKFYKDTVVTPEMADAIHDYLAFITPLKNEYGTWWCEFAISDPSVHEDFYGTVDFAAVNEGVIDVVDFKYGAGITVEAYRNPQLMYYAYGFLLFRPDARRVRLSIVQPRAYHEEGPVRTWEISAEELAEWGEKTLVTAMRAALIDETFDAGPWCRFCPAKLVCPLLDGIYKASAQFDPKRYGSMEDAALGRDYNLIQAIKFRIAAVEKEVEKRWMVGREVPFAKLVNKRSNRVWKPGAEPAIIARVGVKDAYTEPKLKTPAAIEEMGKTGKDLATEFAYMPFNGYSIARADDPRMAVKPELAADVFKDVKL